MLIFPPVPVGLSTEHVNFCGSITLKPDTFYHVLEDICRGLFRHGFKKIAMLNCHGGNTPIIQVLSRELRSELGLAVFMINCGVFFGNQAVKDTVTPGNVWDFHGGEMETSMILAERPELVKMETAQAGIPRKFMGNRSLTVYGPITLGWVSEEWETEDGTPIGIGGGPQRGHGRKGRADIPELCGIHRGRIKGDPAVERPVGTGRRGFLSPVSFYFMGNVIKCP